MCPDYIYIVDAQNGCTASEVTSSTAIRQLLRAAAVNDDKIKPSYY